MADAPSTVGALGEANTQRTAKTAAVVKSRFISHGTLAARDLDATRRFYEAFLGIEVIRTSKVSLMIRLGGEHVYAVVKSPNKTPQERLNHNGIDVATDADVDDAWRACHEQAVQWGLHEITEPVQQHGTYSFMFRDLDDNCWEILSNPKGGYTWIFEQGDLTGKGHFDKEFLNRRPSANDSTK
jgi:catechol 2,3-dioxygenase-like lactoylglutathione lyase family enzyme